MGIRKLTSFPFPVRRNKEVLSKTFDKTQLKLRHSIFNQQTYNSKTFTFLSKSVKFNKEIDWDYSKNGLLWTYNLNYFDFLNQKVIDVDDCIFLINDFIKKLDSHKTGWEPYPISLRAVNWIKFIIRNRKELETQKDFNLLVFNRALYRQLIFL